MRITMKLKINSMIVILLLICSMVNTNFVNTIFDSSISFLENLRRQYKRYISTDDVSKLDQSNKASSINNTNDGDDDQDRNLQLVGDGTVYTRLERNVTFDEGKTYHIVTDFVPLKGSSYTDNYYDDKVSKSKVRKELTEEDEATLPPEPAQLIDYKTTEARSIYPTEQDKSYPSNKDGTYGIIVQLTYDDKPRFARPRGKEVYYFNKIGKDIIFTNVMILVKNNEKKLPPDITSIFKGPDDRYYFIREDAYCRRPLNLSGIGLDPPDYCPEGGDLRELLGCNIRLYSPEVEDLCNNPMIEHSFLAPDNKTAWLIRGKDIWLLHDLPSNPEAAPSKCNLTKHGDATKIWKKFYPKADAVFVIHEANKNPVLVQFYKHKFTVWKFSGGNPLFEAFIKEFPLNENQYKNELFTEKTVEAAVKTVDRPESNIVYKEKPFLDLCGDPTIDSADANLDGTKVYLYKNDVYYILENVKEQGFGKLVKFGKTTELFKEFSKMSAAVMTCKEGRNRGFLYEFNTILDRNNKRPHTLFTNWDINGKVITKGEEWIEPSAAGMVAAFHNRNVTDPVMIGLKGDEVFYYSTVADTFAQKRRSVKHYDSLEKLPSGVGAAFSLPNQIIYLFREKHFCVRELFYNRKPLYCPEWRDSRELFGCFGDPQRPTTVPKKKINDFKAMKDLCSDLNIDDADRTWQRDDMIFVWRKDKFWRLADFPTKPRVVESGLTASKWDGFSENPDAIAIIQEGRVRRGWFYATYGGYWSSWYPDRKPWVGYKAWWGQPTKSGKFGAMMHNGNIKKPLVLGFVGNEVQYYSSEGSLLVHKGGSAVAKTEEHWPSEITAAFRMENDTVYLFRGDKYCQRMWNCSDKTSSCCKEWKEVKHLFKCNSIEEYSVESKISVKDEDYSGNGGAIEPTDDNQTQNLDSGHSSTEGKVTPELKTEEEIMTTEPQKKDKKKYKGLKPNQIFPTPRSRG